MIGFASRLVGIRRYCITHGFKRVSWNCYYESSLRKFCVKFRRSINFKEAFCYVRPTFTQSFCRDAQNDVRQHSFGYVDHKVCMYVRELILLSNWSSWRKHITVSKLMLYSYQLYLCWQLCSS